MKNLIVTIIAGLFVCPLLVSGQIEQGKMQPGWKAGVARANITPDGPIWMAGFGFRNKPSEGVTTDIWASALVLEDESGHRAAFIAIDNAGIRKEFSDVIRARLKTAYNLTNEQVVINCSHTHTGPATSARFLKDEKEKEIVEKYAITLEDQIIEITGKALKSLQPVKIFSGNGVTRFQVNRRNNIQYKLYLQEQFNGPNDYAVPVIKVEKVSGDLLAVLFSYACHASMLRDYKISGDYPAFARMELEKIFPGVTPIFFQGAGGNQIGYPRNTVEATRQAGKSLAAAVERVLSEPMKELPASLNTSYSEINLESDQVPPTKDELIKIASNAGNSDSIRNKATSDLDKLNRGESLVATYPYPVQVWKIGDLPVITLGGEPVVEYAIQLKLIFGQEAFVFGYSNDVMSYISTPLILNEGGYEGSSAPFSSYLARGVKWGLNIEPVIIEEVLKLAKQVGVEMAPKKFAIPGG